MELSSELGLLLKTNKLKISTAESCTAGLIAATIANTPGSSEWLDSGFVVYTPDAKNEILGVHYKTIATYDITSCEVAVEMAKGVLNNRPNVNVIITTTGLAGPGGGTPEIPSGTVCFCWLYNMNGITNIISKKEHFVGSRQDIRTSATQHALTEALIYLNNLNLENDICMPL